MGKKTCFLAIAQQLEGLANVTLRGITPLGTPDHSLAGFRVVSDTSYVPPHHRSLWVQGMFLKHKHVLLVAPDPD